MGTEVQTDLWGNIIPPKEVTVNVYHDEREIPNKWLYHSFLFIPIQNEEDVLTSLDKARQKSEWDKELHFADLEKTDTENSLALEWIDLFSQSLFEKVYFYFFGVDYQKLEKTLWGKSERDFKVYNRFFQIGLYGAIKWFFLTAGFEVVFVQNIFSDKKSRKEEDRFHTQPIVEIEIKSSLKEENIIFQKPEIIEIDSDHWQERDYPLKSHFIQFTDLIMGTFSQIFDNTSIQEGKCMVADKCLKLELPTKLMKYNPNSRYYKKYAISFFPERSLSRKEILESETTSKVNQFYRERPMKYVNEQVARNQDTFEKFLRRQGLTEF